MALACLGVDATEITHVGLYGTRLPEKRHLFSVKTFVQHKTTGVVFVVVTIDPFDLSKWEFDCLETHKHRWANRRVNYNAILKEYNINSIGEAFLVCVESGDKEHPLTWYPFDRCNPFRSPLYYAKTATVSKPSRGWRFHAKQLGIEVEDAVEEFSRAMPSPAPTAMSRFVGASVLRTLDKVRASNMTKHMEIQKHRQEEIEMIVKQRKAYADAQREEEEEERRKYNITRAEPPSEVTLFMLQAPPAEELRALIKTAQVNRDDKYTRHKCADGLRKENCTTDAMSRFLSTFPHAWKGWDHEWLPKLVEIEQVMPMGGGEFALLLRFSFSQKEERRCWVLHSRLLSVRATLWDKYRVRLGKIPKNDWPEWFQRAEEYDTMCYEAMYQRDADEKEVLSGVCPQPNKEDD